VKRRKTRDDTFRNRKFVDSPLEGDGFEPSVPSNRLPCRGGFGKVVPGSSHVGLPWSRGRDARPGSSISISLWAKPFLASNCRSMLFFGSASLRLVFGEKPSPRVREPQSDQPQQDGHVCNVAIRVRVQNLKSRLASGYRDHAYTSRRGSRHGSPLLLRREPLHRAGLGYGLNRLWLAALRGGFFTGRPFCKLGPAVTDVALGVWR